MNKNVKQKWIAALTEGDYRENDGKLLQEDTGYSALGVLVDLYIEDTGEEGWEYDQIGHCYTYTGQTHVLPLAVANWADIPNQPILDRFVVPIMWGGKQTSIGVLGDTLTFHELAEAIERKL